MTEWFPQIVLYHAGCNDGFGAAWTLNNFYRRQSHHPVAFYPVAYGDEIDIGLLRGRDVLMVDVTYKAHQLAILASHVTSLIILDHHKSAAADLAQYAASDDAGLCFRSVGAILEQRIQTGGDPIVAGFNMDKSGCRLAWEFVNRVGDRFAPFPRMLAHIEDRDLWRFDLHGSSELSAALDSYPYDFKTWDRFADQIQGLIEQGAHIKRDRKKMIGDLMRYAVHTEIGGVFVPTLNVPPMLFSDAGHALLERFGDAAFAGVWYSNGVTDQWGLRSDDMRSDVSQVARTYGGGGHRNAAGFKAPAGGVASGAVIPPAEQAAL